MSRWFSFSRFSFRGVVLYSSLSLSLLSPSLSLSLSLSLSRMALRLTDSGEEIHSALVRQEIHEPHEFPMQAPEVDEIKGKKAFSSLSLSDLRQNVRTRTGCCVAQQLP